MLKPTLLIGLVLLQCAMARRENTNYKCLEPINALRAKYAHDYQIANMNELVYDESREMVTWEAMQKAANYDCPKPTINFAFFGPVFADINSDPYTYNLLISVPDFTKISCWKRKCDKTGKDVLSVAVTQLNQSTIRFGPPGSKCGYYTSDYKKIGLCSLPPQPSGYARKSMNLGRSKTNFLNIDDILKKFPKDELVEPVGVDIFNRPSRYQRPIPIFPLEPEESVPVPIAEPIRIDGDWNKKYGKK